MKCNAKHLGQVGATLLVVDDGSHGLYKLTQLQELSGKLMPLHVHRGREMSKVYGDKDTCR